METAYYSVKIPPDLKRKFAHAAKKSGYSMRQILVALIDDWANGHVNITLKIKAPKSPERGDLHANVG